MEVLWTPNGGRLVVTLPEDGILIRCEQATDTFVEVIKRIGIEQVAALPNIEFVSTTEDPNRRQRKVGEYYITMGLNPRDMGRRLNQVAERLGISLYAELFP